MFVNQITPGVPPNTSVGETDNTFIYVYIFPNEVFEEPLEVT